jgi:hypothetical protein
MVICHNKRCIFIHIPKTAGTSIEQFIKDNNNNPIILLGVKNGRSMHHYSALEIKSLFPDIFSKYYKFSFVRNPYDRLLSEYYWCKIPNVGFKYGKTKLEFLYYVSNVIKQKSYFKNIFNDHFIPQYMFVYNTNNELLVNHLFKYEDLDIAIEFIKKKININKSLDKLNKTNTEKTEWSNIEKEIIYSLYEKDFLYFQYKK